MPFFPFIFLSSFCSALGLRLPAVESEVCWGVWLKAPLLYLHLSMLSNAKYAPPCGNDAILQLLFQCQCGQRERERCVGESKCALTAPSSSSFLRPPYSFPFRPLCSSIYLGCSGVMQTQWSWRRLRPPPPVVTLKLSRDGGWQGNNAGVNTTYRTVISVSAQQGDIHTLLGWVVNRGGAPSLNYNHIHTHIHPFMPDVVDWGFDIYTYKISSLFFWVIYHLTNHKIKVTLDRSHSS